MQNMIQCIAQMAACPPTFSKPVHVVYFSGGGYSDTPRGISNMQFVTNSILDTLTMYDQMRSSTEHLHTILVYGGQPRSSNIKEDGATAGDVVMRVAHTMWARGQAATVIATIPRSLQDVRCDDDDDVYKVYLDDSFVIDSDESIRCCGVKTGNDAHPMGSTAFVANMMQTEHMSRKPLFLVCLPGGISEGQEIHYFIKYMGRRLRLCQYRAKVEVLRGIDEKDEDECMALAADICKVASSTLVYYSRHTDKEVVGVGAEFVRRQGPSMICNAWPRPNEYESPDDQEYNY